MRSAAQHRLLANVCARAGVGAVALLMGFNLLELLPLRFPSLDFDVRALRLPPLALAYAAGLTFALAASPCSTPILAAILAYVATQHAPVAGAALLFVYSLGYIAPVIAAASATVRLLCLAKILCCYHAMAAALHGQGGKLQPALCWARYSDGELAVVLALLH
jgi:cytochrome c biogenesis protein CcdA